MYVDYHAIGHRVREERQKHQWTQTALAVKSGISTSHISSIERGSSEFSVGYLVKLANAFDVPTDYLISGDLHTKSPFINVVTRVVGDCSISEMKVIMDNVLNLKKNLRRHYRTAS